MTNTARWMRVVLCFAGAAIFQAQFAAAKPVAGLPDFTELVEKNRAAVVNISTTTKRATPQRNLPPGFNIPGDAPLNEFFRRFFGDEMPNYPGNSRPRSSLGSGFIISKDGYVISNKHVIDGADEVIVRLSDRREFVAELIGTDAKSDIAVLKITTDDDLPVLKIGKSHELRVGEWVLAIGSPFGFDHSVTQGIVSAKGRSLPNENYVPFIQTDVAINPGNSGGPLFNLAGEVVGVNSQIYSRTGGFMGLSFAIPIDVVLNVYEQLKKNGSVTRGWLGVLIQDVTRDLAESFGMAKPHGALVSKVLPDSPAAKAGFKAGDVIVEFNHQSIGTSADLPPIVGTTPVGKAVPVGIIRGGKDKRLSVTIGKLPADDEILLSRAGNNGETFNKRLNITVVELDNDRREQLDANGQGVLVKALQDGPAYDAGLRQGDVILQINNHKIDSLKTFQSVVEKLSAGKSVPVLIQRQGGPLFMAMKLPD